MSNKIEMAAVGSKAMEWINRHRKPFIKDHPGEWITVAKQGKRFVSFSGESLQIARDYAGRAGAKPPFYSFKTPKTLEEDIY